MGDDVVMQGFEGGYVITSPVSLGRVLWWYGEDVLWPQALELAPHAVADLAPRFAVLLSDPNYLVPRWPGGRLEDAHLVLGTIEHLEGQIRPAARRQRRRRTLPEIFDVSERDRWHDPQLEEVAHLIALRETGPWDSTPPWLRPRTEGRWAPG